MTMSSLRASYKEHMVMPSLVKDSIVVLGASLLIGVLSRISIPLPFTPIPLSLGPQAVLFIALCLGSKRGTLAALAYVAEGVLGLPVFSQGRCGLLALCGPTGGYLLGYIAAAFVTGYLAENLKSKKSSAVFAVMALGNAVIYVFGAAWLSRFIGASHAITLGIIPFVVLDAMKVMAASRFFSFFRK